MSALKSQVDKNKVYSLTEAFALVKKTSNVKFDASVEVHAILGIDPKKTEQQIRTTVVLPHGTGKNKKVAAFVGANDEKKAKEAGADFVKTSTGFASGGATAEDIALMAGVVRGAGMEVKASGGIRSFTDAKRMIEAGATRIGASASVAIVQEAQKVPVGA